MFLTSWDFADLTELPSPVNLFHKIDGSFRLHQLQTTQICSDRSRAQKVLSAEAVGFKVRQPESLTVPLANLAQAKQPGLNCYFAPSEQRGGNHTPTEKQPLAITGS
ncbi:hypothetical protein HDF12_000804 [Edaphobacter lichenicola]|uniref:Uncharacterized protein n=1 Tax=Tunturiibacter lichenicola TaxID=2051959 RepID=A0A7Y9NJE5_9BACT|nr:hypothetical protein [Edaphobacter lichenicola]